MSRGVKQNKYFGSALKKYREENNIVLKVQYVYRKLYVKMESGETLCNAVRIPAVLSDYGIVENTDEYMKLYILDYISNIEDYCNLSKLFDIIRILMFRPYYDFRKEFKITMSDNSLRNKISKPLINRIQMYFGMSIDEIVNYNFDNKSVDDIINDAKKALSYYNELGIKSKTDDSSTIKLKYRTLFGNALCEHTENCKRTYKEMQGKVDTINMDFYKVENNKILPMVLNVEGYLAAYGLTYNRTWKYRYILSYLGRSCASYDRNIHYILISLRLSLCMTDDEFHRLMHITSTKVKYYTAYPTFIRLRYLFNITDTALIEGENDCLGRLIDVSINGAEYFKAEGHKMIGEHVDRIYI